MKPPLPSTRLNTSADAICVGLQVNASLIGLTSDTISLSSQDGSITLKAPARAFPNVKAAPGELLIVSITLMRNVIEPIEAGPLAGMDS